MTTKQKLTLEQLEGACIALNALLPKLPPCIMEDEDMYWYDLPSEINFLIFQMLKAEIGVGWSKTWQKFVPLPQEDAT